MTKVFITGANGFVGRAIVKDLKKEGYDVLESCRSNTSTPNSKDLLQIDLTSEDIEWLTILGGVDTVIHTAARVHVMNNDELEPLLSYREVNTKATLNLAKYAGMAGVKRFIFISTIKVNGEQTQSGHFFREDLQSFPQDPYAISKWEAEQGLIQLSEESGLEVVIIRPALVYGPGVKGNFAVMAKWVKRGIPLPFGAVHNKRSYLALDNLVSFVLLCLHHPKAANQTFVLADGEDISTPELLNNIAHSINKRVWLLSIPVNLMTRVARLLGKGALSQRLFGSLQVDISKAKDMLGWRPVISMKAQLNKMNLRG